jgi:hypothetical protein
MEIERDAVHAVAQSRWSRPVGKDMPDVAPAIGAVHFGATMNQLRSMLVSTPSDIGDVKLGQPVPLSNFASDENSG